MWGTDLTSTLTGEGRGPSLDSSSRSTTPGPNAWASTPPGEQPASRRSSRCAKPCAPASALSPRASRGGLKLRHDPCGAVGIPHPTGCSQLVADDCQRELGFLGIASSPAFVREPEGNGCAERFIRTLKENLLGVGRFATIEELRQALHAFKETYNRAWMVERHGYQTPAAVRAAQLASLPVAA